MLKEIIKDTYLVFRGFLLSCFGILSVRSVSLNAINTPRKILFIRIDRIGDLILCTPAFKAIKKRFPNATLTVLCSTQTRSLLKNNPWIDQIHLYDKSRSLLEFFRVVKELRNQSFDIAIDTHAGYELLPALIAFFSSRNIRIGYSSYGRGAFFNVRLPDPFHNRHFVDIALDALKPLKIDSTHRTPEIFLSDDEAKWAADWLRAKGIKEKRLIGLHPGAHFKTQRWPASNFTELIQLIEKDHQVDIIIFGSQKEKKFVDEIASKKNNSLVTFISNDLRRFAALLAECRIFICNNSGPLHMAVALGIPTISTMGPTVKERWMPIGDSHKVLRMDELPCIGCNLGYCKIKTHDCMKMITPIMVFEAVQDLISINYSSSQTK